MKLILPLDLSSWLSLKLLWLSKHTYSFLAAPSSWDCAKICQCPMGENVTQHPDAHWLKGRLSTSSFYIMQRYLFQGRTDRMTFFSAPFVLNPQRTASWELFLVLTTHKQTHMQTHVKYKDIFQGDRYVY